MQKLLSSLFLCCVMQAAVADPGHNVSLATTNWPPYVGSDLKGYGYIYAIIHDAYQATGYNTSITFLPWAEATQLDLHHFDGYFPEYDGTSLKNLACSDPIQGGPVGLYRLKDSPIRYLDPYPNKDQTKAFEALKQYRFGVVSGYKNTAAFDSAGYLIKIPANDDLENLRHLNEGKVDLAFIDVFVAEYLIEKYNPEFSNLVFMGPSLENKKLYVCFSRNAPNYIDKLAALNHGLSILKDSGKIDQIIEEYQ